MWTVEVVVMAAMIAANSVFAAYEIALASVGLARLDSLAREGRSGAAAALRMKGNMEASLAVVQLGITLVGVIAAATGGAGAEEMIEPTLTAAGLSPGAAQFAAIALVVLPLTVATILFGELVPKVFALRNNELVCLKLSRPMEWFARSVWPVVWCFETLVNLIATWGERMWRGKDTVGASDSSTLQELRALAALARTSRLIGAREEGIIVNAARLSRTPLRAVMLPEPFISTVVADEPLEAALLAAHHDMHTRFPVTEDRGDRQRIVGYVNFKDIVSGVRLAPSAPSVRSILRPMASFDSELPAASAFERMILEHQHIALVRDKAGRVLGMVTLEDILEELVGEIHDEFDRLPSQLVRAGAGWICGGGITLKQLADVTGLPWPGLDGTPTATLAAWVEERLGRAPSGGDVVDDGPVRVLVRKLRRHRVYEAQVSPRA